MFVTLPQFHHPVLDAAASGQQHWSAVVASFPLQPWWYLFVYEAKYLDTRINNTMLVSWEELLIRVLGSVPATDHRALYRVELGEAGDLVFKSVQALWAPSSSEAEACVGAVFRFDGNSELLGADLRPVSELERRSVVFWAGPRTSESGPEMR
ncbi:hypothetical protein [Ramlibacter humi]|uniref:Uncharacterized protein n=1 Tax=Ramlibacter humi TaxID=2530451 RepID=A0A4Z0CCX4_9BURK|nr:hypothetical protein [Ramlibacter humi]TFZ08954.1 hypothetical protein EZ216_07375 [Ramlibacter humi]